MLEINRYNIAQNVHIYRQGDLNIAYDVNSGSLHILDDKTFELIAAMIRTQHDNKHADLTPQDLFAKAGANLSPQELDEILSELGELQKANLLFSPEAEKIDLHYPAQPLIKAMCLHVAHDCNLRCRYCFAGTGPFGGKRALMSFETGKLALDFLLKSCGNRPHCEVDFFGGEPLMNLRVVKELVAYGKEIAASMGKTIKYTLTTNAVLLDDSVVDYLEQEGISVVLSLDGRREVNDRMRPNVGGQGSYDRIMPQILRFVGKRPDTSRYAVGKYYYVRGTFTRYNTDFYQDVLHLVDLGVKRISVEPVVAPPETEYALREEDLPKVKESYDILGEKVLEYLQNGKEFSFFHFNAGLDDGPCLQKRLSGCGAGHEYIAVSPEGDIYPCHQFVGQEKYKLGSLYEPEKGLKADVISTFRQANIYAKEDCRVCWARFSCSGGCHAANEAFNGTLTEVYRLGCELQKKRLEVAYYLKIKEARLRTLVAGK